MRKKMWMIPVIIVVLVFFTTCQEKKKLSANILLGFGRCDPVVFTPITTPLTVKISLISRVPRGPIQSYEEQIISVGEGILNIRVKINLKKFNYTGLCDSKMYTVETAGKMVPSHTPSEFRSMEKHNLIGFSPAEVAINPSASPMQREYRPEGAVLCIPGMNMPGELEGDFVTKYTYSGYGRRKLASQIFTLDGIQYEIKYSDYSYQGKMSGYTARLTRKLD